MTTTTKLAALLTASALLLGACSDGDKDESSDDDTTETSEPDASGDSGESSESSIPGPSINPDAPEADSQFCQDATELMTSSADSADEDAMDFADSLEPPDEIATEWRSMLDATRAVNEADASGDPEASQKAMETYQAISEDINKVLQYLQNQCGIDAGV